jgi:uncharacterized protein YqhQ
MILPISVEFASIRVQIRHGQNGVSTMNQVQMSPKSLKSYGGQAVIEGVMMRGAQIAAISVRAPDGSIVTHEQPLNATLYRGRISKTPFLRGMVGLWDALGLGTRALLCQQMSL